MLELKTGVQSQKLWAYGMIQQPAAMQGKSQEIAPIVPSAAPPLVAQPGK
jgi:hypothetical protein